MTSIRTQCRHAARRPICTELESLGGVDLGEIHQRQLKFTSVIVELRFTDAVLQGLRDHAIQGAIDD
jgi:hypothetical protein